jgi:stage IV sporulation protein FB
MLHELQRDECPAWPVVEKGEGKLVGLLTAENLGEYLMIRAALRPSDDTGYIRRP